mmetsp:Transcript_66863/g.145823  ORF Transcript_66863/g.145823 Transcript_66863/m.145823 type:complete len:236 (-) Transcript_66863:305-1012(-)
MHQEGVVAPATVTGIILWFVAICGRKCDEKDLCSMLLSKMHPIAHSLILIGDPLIGHGYFILHEVVYEGTTKDVTWPALHAHWPCIMRVGLRRLIPTTQRIAIHFETLWRRHSHVGICPRPPCQEFEEGCPVNECIVINLHEVLVLRRVFIFVHLHGEKYLSRQQTAPIAVCAWYEEQITVGSIFNLEGQLINGIAISADDKFSHEVRSLRLMPHFPYRAPPLDRPPGRKHRNED